MAATRPVRISAQFVADEHDPRAPPPAHFGTHLYPPQAAMVARALEMEQTRVMPFVKEFVDAPGMPPEPFCIEFDAGSIRCPFGSGKTVIVCALVASRMLPRPVPTMYNIATRNYNEEHVKQAWRVCVDAGPGDPYSMWTDEESSTPVLLEHRNPRWMSATLVFVSSSVFNQWIESVERFAPCVSCYAVTGRVALLELARMVKTGEAAVYDMVIVKTGTVSMEYGRGKNRNVIVPDGCGVRRSVHVAHALSGALPVTWARLVLDDFDTLSVPAGAALPVAHFTWYVSATQRQGGVRQHGAPRDSAYQEVMRYALSRFSPGAWPITAAASDEVVMTSLAITSSEDFIKDTQDLPAPDYTVYWFKPTGALKFLTGVLIPPKIIEAVSSGAMSFAGAEVGTVCKTEAEVVLAVVNSELSLFRDANIKMEAIKSVKQELSARWEEHLAAAGAQARPAAARPTRSATVNMLRSVCTEVNRGWVPTPENPLPPTFPQDATLSPEHQDRFDAAVKKLRDKLEARIKKHGRALERLRENMQDGDCQVCLLPYSECHTPQDSATYIMNCCQIVVCPICVRGGNINSGTFVGHCPLCRKAAKSGSVIRLDAGIDLAAIQNVTSESALQMIQDGAAASSAIHPEQPPEITDVKIRGLLDLLAGRWIVCERSAQGSAFAHLMGASGPYVPSEAGEPRKVLLFATLRESAMRIREAVEATGVPAPVLRGTSDEKSATVARFRESREPLTVLVVTGTQDSAGVHIPEATDVVFFHRVWCEAVGSQFVGRAQRPGRVSSLRVHLFAYVGIEEERQD